MPATPLGRAMHTASPGELRARHRSLPIRALSLIPGRLRRRLLGGAAAAAICFLPACGGEAAGQGQLGAAEIARRIEKLIELSTPLEPTLTSDHHDRQLHEQRALMEELRRSGPALGRRALEAYEEHSDESEPLILRVNLLEVGAHAAPEDARPLLVKLATEYGYEMGDRTEAVRLLAETSPQTALEVLEPLVTRSRRSSTLPNDEFLIRGYVTACKGTGTSPVRVLADYLTNIHKEEAARHYAAEALGNYDDPLGIKALEAVLVESTGNGYLRRKAAQSLRKLLPPESACQLFRNVADHEADTGFLEFLANLIEAHCS